MSGGVAQEVCAGVVLTFDPELRAEESAAGVVAGVDKTAVTCCCNVGCDL